MCHDHRQIEDVADGWFDGVETVLDRLLNHTHAINKIIENSDRYFHQRV